MAGGVFQKVREHLLDEHGVHRHEHHRFGQLRRDRNARKMRFEFGNGGEDDLLGDFVLLFDARRFQADARYGKEIFHHADEPFGVVVDAAEKLLFLPVRKVVVFQKRDRRAGDCRKGRAQIVRNRPQEIGAHAFGLCLHADALLPLERRRQRVDRERNGEHREERERIAGQGKVKVHIRIGENIVHRKNAQKRDDRAAEIPVRQQ